MKSLFFILQVTFIVVLLLALSRAYMPFGSAQYPYLIEETYAQMQCISNDQCLESEFCYKSEGDCDGQGVCSPKPEACISVWDPVCGCDGMTYANICYAAATGINVAYPGECQAVSQCISNDQCLESEFCYKSEGDCDGRGVCSPKPEACPDVWEPVCGCDGMTYSNACYAAGSGINVAYPGECQAVSQCISNDQCLEDEFCYKSEGDCDGQGRCTPRPQYCITLWDPVCGCDGITYANLCTCAMSGVNIAYPGECQTVTECMSNDQCLENEFCKKAEGDCEGQGMCSQKPLGCPDVWNPVCGCDGITYSNTCDAEAVGMNIAYVGECSEEPLECIEGSDGELDIPGSRGERGKEILIPIMVQSSPDPVYSFGIEVAYDPEVLEYVNFELGELTTSFDMVDVNPIAINRVKIGGFANENVIPQGSSGSLILLRFLILDGEENRCYPLTLEKLKDDLSHFSSTGGCFCIHSCEGDLNGDGSITPGDALIAFQCYLEQGSCPNGVDVDKNGDVTPADALCLFRKYLELPSCVDALSSDVIVSPEILEVTPSIGYLGSFAELTISGKHFIETPKISFQPAEGIRINATHMISSTRIFVHITIEPSASLPSRNLIVENPDGGKDTYFYAFTISDQKSDIAWNIVKEGGLITVPDSPPDSDGDGVPDYRDRNPGVAGKPEYDGDTKPQYEWRRSPNQPPWPPQIPSDWDKEAEIIVYSELEAGEVQPGDVVTYRVEEGATEWIMTGWSQTAPWTLLSGPYPSSVAHSVVTGTIWYADYQRELEITCSRFKKYRFVKMVNGKEVARYAFYEYLKETKRIKKNETKTVQVGHTLGDAPNEVPPQIPTTPSRSDTIFWLEFADQYGNPLKPLQDYSGMCKNIN
ncbi:MAG: Kazal-type serine protease inhibitor domain-containing protein [bacterium]